MEAEDLLHIKISRVIHAPRWRVIRQLTRVGDFAARIPTIQNVLTIERSRNTLKTSWQIVIDGLPLQWVELDTLDLRNNIIYFQALEGDLNEFRGSWRFDEHPGGTEVKVEIQLRVGIPGVESFTAEYVRPLVKKNFELILDAIEQRLVSSRYASFKKGHLDKIAGFGILGHFYNYHHMVKSFQMLSREFREPSREFLNALFRVTPSFTMHRMNEFRSRTGEITHGHFILCTFIPDMIDHDLEAVYAKVVRGCKLAEKSGVGIVALGGFSSIVGERLGRRIAEDVDIPITTGNTFTAAMAVDGVLKAAELLEKDFRDLKVAIVGGTGDIGSACALALASRARQITLTGRTGSSLRFLQGNLKRLRLARIEATKDNRKAVRDADVVIAAANSSAAILKMEWFKPGAIVCDLGYPKNLSYKATRQDILVFSGGLASVPSPIDPGNDIGVPSPDVCYGCFCEAIILALERRYENFSFGRGNITLEKMDEIRSLGHRHGFDLAPFLWSNGMTRPETLQRVREAAGHA